MIAAVGSISSGTLRTPDLLRAFAAALESMEGDESREPSPDWDAGKLCGEALAYADVLDVLSGVSADGVSNVEICAASVVDSLINALDEYASEGCYFGAHEGDGADFGFWPAAETVAS